MLSEDGKRLSAEAQEVLRITAAPTSMLSVVANNADNELWVETSFVHGQNDSGYVALAANDQIYDFAFLPTSVQAAVLIDDMLGLTAMISRPGESRVSLGLAGYSAVLATADVLQATRLQARLERARRPVSKLTAVLLEEQLTKGLNNVDTRWAVTAGRMVCPSSVMLAQGNMGQGLQQLKAAGLVDGPSAGEFALTRDGYMLASNLGQLAYTGGLSLAVGYENDHRAIAHASLFRTAVAIWMVTWSSVSTQDASAELFQSSAAGAISFIRNLLHPAGLPELSDMDKAAAAAQEPVAVTGAVRPAGEVYCRQCGHRIKESARFCSNCGSGRQ